MAGITLAQAEARLADLMTAHEAITVRGQSYTIGDRTLTRADLSSIREDISFWDTTVKRIARGGIRSRLGTPT